MYAIKMDVYGQKNAPVTQGTGANI